MESVSISSDKNSSFGVNVDPLVVGLGVGFDVKYTVSESLNDRGILVKPTLNTLLSMTESYMLSDTSVKTVENVKHLRIILQETLLQSRRILHPSLAVTSLVKHTDRQCCWRLMMSRLKRNLNLHGTSS